MSLSSKNVASIQKAGQAVHSACESIAESVRIQAASMLNSVSTKPFDAESEQAISRFKSLSRLNLGLAEVETKLQELFAVANDLASPASEVIALPAPSKRKASNAAAVDVVAKPAKVAKATKGGKKGRKPSLLTANDNKLLAYLQGALKSDAWTRLPGNAMSSGSGMPVGSIALSLKKLMNLGAVKSGSRGHYQLGAAVAAPAVAHVAEAAPAKKAKKVKAVKAEAAAPVAGKAVKVAKAKPAKAVQPAPAKKAKAAPAKKTKAVKAKVEAAPVEAAPAQPVAEAAPV